MKKLISCMLIALLLSMASVSFADGTDGTDGPPVLTKGKTILSALFGTGVGLLVATTCPIGSVVPWIAGSFAFANVNAAAHDVQGEDTYTEDAYNEFGPGAFVVTPATGVGDLLIPHD